MKITTAMKKPGKRVKAGQRLGNTYCRKTDGKIVQHKGGRYAPGSRIRKYTTKDDLIAEREKANALLREENAALRESHDVMNAALRDGGHWQKLEKDNALLREEIAELRKSHDAEYERGVRYEWNRWTTWLKEGDVVVELNDMPSDPFFVEEKLNGRVSIKGGAIYKA